MAEYSYKILRISLASVFICSGVLKLSDMGGFADIIGAYGLIPENLNEIAAIFISVAEIIGGVLLLFDFFIGHAAVFIMLIAFIIILSYGVHLGLDIDCGCFGEGSHESKAFSSLKTSILRDMLFLSALICLSFKKVKNKVKKNYGGDDVSV